MKPNNNSQFVPTLLLSNTMSLAPKIDEIAFTIQQKDIQVGFFTETWLKDSIADDPIAISGYHLFRLDRKNKQHGGVCLYVKNTIESKTLPVLYKEDYEVLWCILRPKRLPRGFSNIIAGVLYHPPGANNIAMKEHLKSSLEIIETHYPNSGIVLAGDFNQLDFKSTAKLFNLKPAINFPTRGTNTLDQIFTNLKNFYNPAESGPPFGLSDHVTITMIPAKRVNLRPQKTTIKVRDKRPSNVASLGRFLLNIPWENTLSSLRSSDDKLTTFTEIINYGLNTIMPERSIKVNPNDRPWMTSHLKRLILQRQKAFALGNNFMFKLLRNKVNRERKRCRKVYYKKKVGNLLDSKPKDWWREVKQLSGQQSTRPDLRSMIRFDVEDSDEGLGNRINEAFISVMKEFPPLPEDFNLSTDNDEPISVTETTVERLLRAISVSKASGPDELPNWVLKSFSDILAPAITDIFNASFRECKVPRVWKIADVPPVPKAKNITDFNKDLRPISLTSTLSKIAENLIIEYELKSKLLRKMDPMQFGFIPGSNTTLALISMMHTWLDALDGTGSTVRVALLDYRKAFDLVDHNLLVAKLSNYEIKPTVVNWIADFLRGRTQRVKINSAYSNFLQVPAGIPQGTKIGPWLFLAIINDLCITKSPTSNLWKFADDTSVSEVIPKDGVSSLPDKVDEVNKWSNDNKFQLNPGKCKELRINFTTQPFTEEPLNTNEKPFEIVKSAKVLGMIVTNDLKWNKHVSNTVEKASKRLYLLRQLKRAEVETRSLYKFYTACIRSVVEYACQVFHSSLPNYLSMEIESIQKRAVLGEVLDFRLFIRDNTICKNMICKHI